jgi:hypothetical protein
MQTILLSHEEVARLAKQLYESSIRQQVELEENIGKMVIIDIETGEYEVDKNGLQAARNLSIQMLGSLVSESDIMLRLR